MSEQEPRLDGEQLADLLRALTAPDAVEQRTKTRSALELFSAELAADAPASRGPG